MIIRTVLDLRPNVPKYAFQAILLTASWHRYARDFAPLQILVIGDLPAHLNAFFVSLGAEIRSTTPIPNDTYSKTSNAILGASPEPGTQILLVDNDIVFTGDPAQLHDLSKKQVHGAIAGGARVSNDHWSFIESKLNLSPLPCEDLMPIKERVTKLANPNHVPKTLNVIYPNAGVILFPADYDFRSTWERHHALIAGTFAEHHLAHESVISSNMAALATTIGSYGRFEWLPPGFNYRHACFALGLCSATDIRVVHMTGMEDQKGIPDISRWVEAYWRKKMQRSLRKISAAIPEKRNRERHKILNQVRDNILETASMYDLDKLTRLNSLTRTLRLEPDAHT